MEKGKTKFKYLMNIWKSLEQYPIHEDVQYEILSYFAREGKKNEFSMQTLNSVYGKGWEDTKYFELIQEMIVTGNIIKIDRNTGGKAWYKIKEIKY